MEEEAWIAREPFGGLFVYTLTKPYQLSDGMWVNDSNTYFGIPEYMFPTVNKDDKKPTKIKLILEK